MPQIRKRPFVINRKLNQKKILIADNHPLCRKYLYRYLEEKGHHCEEASNGLMCLNMVKMALSMKEESEDFDCRCYDIVIINFKMPEMNGIDVTKSIRQLGFPGMMIGVTEAIYSERVDLFLNAGATMIIKTPIELDAVNNIINKCS